MDLKVRENGVLPAVLVYLWWFVGFGCVVDGVSGAFPSAVR